MRCLWFRFYYFFSEIGLGWMPAIMNSEAERDFIKDSQRLLSDVRTFWIGGFIPASGASNFPSYIPRQPEEGSLVEFSKIRRHFHWCKYVTKSRPIESTKSWGKVIFTGRNEVVAKVMFLQVCVCPQGGGCLPQCMLGCHTPPGPGRPTPPGPGRPTPPDGEPPRWRTPPGPGRPPPREADSSIRSTSGRYASYWNAFLFQKRVSRILSVEGVHWGRAWRGHAWRGGMCGRQGVCVAGGHAWQGAGMCGRQAACVTHTTIYGQWAGGTHPIGMHSRFETKTGFDNFKFPF